MIAVYDRNISDISYAKMLLEKIKKSSFSSLDPTELQHWNSGLKGMLNYTDLNRIEENCRVMFDLLRVTGATKTNWTAADLPKQEDYERIVKNVELIKQQKYTGADTPATPSLPLNHYEKINAIEKILLDAWEVYQVNNVVVNYIEEFYADEQIGVI